MCPDADTISITSIFYLYSNHVHLSLCKYLIFGVPTYLVNGSKSQLWSQLTLIQALFVWINQGDQCRYDHIEVL